jgi:ribose transport system substrate-binding protein
MKRNLIALTMAAAMVVSLAGCGSSGAATSSAASTEPASSAAASTASTADASSAATAGKDITALKLAFIVGTENDAFYQTVEKGIKDECAKLGIKNTTFGDQQLNATKCTDLINTYVAGKYDAIALSCNDKAGVVPAFKDANAAKIPMFTFDCTLDAKYADQYQAFVGTNNKAGGEVAGKYILSQVKDGDVVACITYASAQSCIDRQAGFEDTIKAGIAGGKKITLATSQDANDDQSKASDIMQDLVTKYGSKLSYVFVVGDPTGYGALSSIQSMGASTKIVGFDAGETACKYIADTKKVGKTWVADVAQDPHGIGAGIVDKMAEYFKTGKVAEKDNELTPTLVTAENVSQYLK